MAVKTAEELKFDGNGLIPAVVQDWQTGRVLMVAWMDRTAVSKTLETSQAHFWSRKRRTLWRKGETSGNMLHVHCVQVDCDADTLLLLAEPSGPTCHTGQVSCFYRELK